MMKQSQDIRKAQADYRAGNITAAQYMSLTKIPIMDLLFHRRQVQKHLLAAPRGAAKKGTK